LGVNSGVSLTTGDSNIDIGNPGVAAEAATIRIGVQGTQTRTFVAGISGSPTAGTSVVVNPTGRLGTVAPRNVSRTISKRWIKRVKRSWR
jgi:hypothetical protein